MRLIDADKIEWFVHKIPTQRHKFVPFVTKSQIDKMPTIEAEPIRHGKWKKVSDKAPKYSCTECHHLYNNKEYKRCPCCGAKMDGKEQQNG